MAVTTAGSTAEIAFKSASRPALATSAACWERASCVTAESIAQYFKSPKCLLAELAFFTTETSLASSVRLCESRAKSRIRNAEEPARIASSRTDRKISLRRIEKFGINRVHKGHCPHGRSAGPFTLTVEVGTPPPPTHSPKPARTSRTSRFRRSRNIITQLASQQKSVTLGLNYARKRTVQSLLF